MSRSRCMNLISHRKTTVSTYVADNALCIAVVYNRILVLVNLITFQMNIIYVSRTACGGYYARLQVRVSINRAQPPCVISASEPSNYFLGGAYLIRALHASTRTLTRTLTRIHVRAWPLMARAGLGFCQRSSSARLYVRETPGRRA